MFRDGPTRSRPSVRVLGGGDGPQGGWARASVLALVAVAVACAAAFSGCTNVPRRNALRDRDEGGFFGWHMQAPFDTSDVQTVYVGFKNQTFRRDVQLMLTEAIMKEISLRTPYTVVGDPEKADSLLTGEITTTSKNLIVEAPTNLPRELNTTMVIWVKWTHNPPTEYEERQPPTRIMETLNFVPEAGQTTLIADSNVTENIAKQIVDMMEKPWFTDEDLE